MSVLITFYRLPDTSSHLPNPKTTSTFCRHKQRNKSISVLLERHILPPHRKSSQSSLSRASVCSIRHPGTRGSTQPF